MAQFYKGLKANLPTTYEESAYYQTIDTGELFFAVSKTELMKIGGSGDDKGKELVLLHFPEGMSNGNVIVKSTADSSVLLTIPYEGEDIGFRVADGVGYSCEFDFAGYKFVPISRVALGDTVRHKTVIGNPIANGVYIGYTDGSTSPYNVLVPGKTPEGVVVRTSNMAVLLHPSEGSSKQWSENTTTEIPGVVTASTTTDALKDFNGKSNTDAVIASGLAGDAFTWVRDLGADWYMPAVGEWKAISETSERQEQVNTALGLIGGTEIGFSSRNYRFSTQYTARDAWGTDYITHSFAPGPKNYNSNIRAVRTFLY